MQVSPPQHFVRLVVVHGSNSSIHSGAAAVGVLIVFVGVVVTTDPDGSATGVTVVFIVFVGTAVGVVADFVVLQHSPDLYVIPGQSV